MAAGDEPARISDVIDHGACHVLFAYDVGHAIDLDHVERLITADRQRARIKYKRHAPHAFQTSPAPVRIVQAAPTIRLAGIETAPQIEAVIYDFGAMTLVYTAPFSGPLGGLLRLSDELYDNAALLEDSRGWVEEIVAAIGPAVSKLDISPLVEDYVIYQIGSLGGGIETSRWVEEHRRTIAQLLRGEALPLSEQEVADALAFRSSYTPDDLVLIDWNAAIVFDPDAEDIRTVLEHANVELLELRFLDERLDEALTQAYDALARRSRPHASVFSNPAADLQRVAQMQADSATLFEGVSNALKLIGDEYLARLYRLASKRLHLHEWDAGILRKLQTLESIYSKISDQQAARRMEILEWIIILLIALSIVLTFFPGVAGH